MDPQSVNNRDIPLLYKIPLLYGSCWVAQLLRFQLVLFSVCVDRN